MTVTTTTTTTTTNSLNNINMTTKTFRFSQVEEGFSSKLGIFEKPKMDTAVLQHTKERIYPTTSVTQGGPIMFKIDPSVGYIDGVNTTLTMEVSIKHAATGKAVVSTDDVCLANLPIHTAFNQIVATVGGTEMNSEEGTMHGYKQMIDMLIFTSKEYKETVATSAGYYPDGVGSVGTTSSITATTTTTPANPGAVLRHALTKDGGTTTFTATLGLEWLENIQKYFVNGCTIYITLYQAPEKMRLIAKDDTVEYVMKIENIYLTACIVHVRPEVLIAHSEEFNSGKNALYAYPKTSMRSHVMPKGINSYDVTQILGDKVPNFLIVSMVSCESYAGKYSLNCYNFEHNDLSEIVLEIDNHAIPGRPFTPDISNKKYTAEYAEFQAATGNLGNGISRDGYAKGHSLFVFNICHHVDVRDSIHPIIRKGHTRLCLKFKSNLAASTMLILYMRSSGFYQITQARNCIVEY